MYSSVVTFIFQYLSFFFLSLFPCPPEGRERAPKGREEKSWTNTMGIYFSYRIIHGQ